MSKCNYCKILSGISRWPQQASDNKLFGAVGIVLSVRGLTKLQLRVDNKTIFSSCSHWMLYRLCARYWFKWFFWYFFMFRQSKSHWAVQEQDRMWNPPHLHMTQEVSQLPLPVVNNQFDKIMRKGTAPIDWCSDTVYVLNTTLLESASPDRNKLNWAVKLYNTYAKRAGAKFMTKLDTTSGYHQIPLDGTSGLLTHQFRPDFENAWWTRWCCVPNGWFTTKALQVMKKKMMPKSILLLSRDH